MTVELVPVTINGRKHLVECVVTYETIAELAGGSKDPIVTVFVENGAVRLKPHTDIFVRNGYAFETIDRNPVF